MSAFYEPGNYVCHVVDQAFQMTKTNRPMLVLRVRVTHKVIDEGLPSEQLHPVQDYERTIRLVVVEENEKSMEMMMRKLRYAGFMGDSFRDLKLVDCDIRASCRESTYEGQPTEDWDLMLPPLASSEPLEGDPKLVRKLDALFGRQLKATAKKEKLKAVPSSKEKEATAKTTSKETVKEAIQKKDAVEKQEKSSIHSKEKSKTGKRIVSGIRKMFNIFSETKP